MPPMVQQPPQTGALPIVYARGSFVVVERGAALPPRCVRCAKPVSLPMLRLDLAWMDAVSRDDNRLLRLLPVGRRFFTRRHARRNLRTATIDAGLCGRHKALRSFGAPLA